MHQKITCRSQVMTSTTAGEQLESWQDIATVWAEIRSQSGDLTTSARQSHISTIYKVRLRYQDKLLSTRNILWQGQAYRVSSLLDQDNRKRVLEFDMVKEIRI